jgi:cell division protein FtsZ
MAFDIYEDGASGTVIKVIGVGGAGGNALNNMIRKSAQGQCEVEYIAANTDRQALSQSLAEKTIQLGTTGLGAGARPEMGAQAANEAREEIAAALRGANMVFITAGMGGGTGTGAAPIVAEVSQELGILTVAVVTKPFSFEGARRMRNANAGLATLKNRVHSLIVILNDKLEEELGEDATMKECFEKADEVLYNACSGIAEIIYKPGVINADFEDVRTVMSERGTAMMGAAEASGPDRAETAASSAIQCPLLEGVSLKGARGILVNISATETLKQSEVRKAMETIRNFADTDANVVFGAVYDETMGDRMRVTVIATGLDQEGTDSTFVNQGIAARATESSVWTPAAGAASAAPSEPAKDVFAPIKAPSASKAMPPQWNPEPQPAAAFAPRYTAEKQPQAAAPEAKPEPVSAPAAAPAAAPAPQSAPVQPQPHVTMSAPQAVGQPISQPDGGMSAPQRPVDNTVFGSIRQTPRSASDIFATLGQTGQGGSGLWTSSPTQAAPHQDAPKEAEKPAETGFTFNIPDFLRKGSR